MAQTTGATRAIPADDLDPGRERRPLESYFQEIGGTRTLRREEEVLLAKELEAATQELREALYAIPICARHVVQRWDALRALSHTGAKLSESIGSEETGEIAARVALGVLGAGFSRKLHATAPRTTPNRRPANPTPTPRCEAVPRCVEVVDTSTPPAIQSSTSQRSWALCHRSSGSLAKHFFTTRSRTGGVIGWSFESWGGSSFMMALIRLA